MLEKGTIIKSKFKNENNDYYYGEIKFFQEETSHLARGYFVKFNDYRDNIFLNTKVIDELYEVVEEKLNEEVFKVNDNGQISFI